MFTVASYNILADRYLNPAWYPTVEPRYLDPRQRHPALVERIAGLAADALCLQEVEPPVFDLLSKQLVPKGYEGHYAIKGGGKPDGCATFLKKDALSLRSIRTLLYADGQGGQADSGHIALIALVEHQGHQLALANTHLRWDPPGTPDELQLGLRQVRQLLAARAQLAAGVTSWILGGDLNVTAESAVVRALVSAGWVDSYAAKPTMKTCVANGQARRIDYLFHSPDLQTRVADLPFIDHQSSLPSLGEPSDHLPLLAEIVMNSEV